MSFWPTIEVIQKQAISCCSFLISSEKKVTFRNKELGFWGWFIWCWKFSTHSFRADKIFVVQEGRIKYIQYIIKLMMKTTFFVLWLQISAQCLSRHRTMIKFQMQFMKSFCFHCCLTHRKSMHVGSEKQKSETLNGFKLGLDTEWKSNSWIPTTLQWALPAPSHSVPALLWLTCVWSLQGGG